MAIVVRPPRSPTRAPHTSPLGVNAANGRTDGLRMLSIIAAAATNPGTTNSNASP